MYVCAFLAKRGSVIHRRGQRIRTVHICIFSFRSTGQRLPTDVRMVAEPLFRRQN